MSETPNQNLFVANLRLEDGCDQSKGEVNQSWIPLFPLYSDLFVDMIIDAINEWIADNLMKKDTDYQVIFRHVVEHDGGGAVLGEMFIPINVFEDRPLTINFD